MELANTVEMVALRPHMDTSAGKLVQIGDVIETHQLRARELKALGMAAYVDAEDDTLGQSPGITREDVAVTTEPVPPQGKAAPAPSNKAMPPPANKATPGPGPANSKGA